MAPARRRIVYRSFGDVLKMPFNILRFVVETARVYCVKVHCYFALAVPCKMPFLEMRFRHVVVMVLIGQFLRFTDISFADNKARAVRLIAVMTIRAGRHNESILIRLDAEYLRTGERNN